MKKWKTLGRKRAERMMWELWHAKRAATLKNSNFTQELKNKVERHHRSWIVIPLEIIIDEICELYNLQKPKE